MKRLAKLILAVTLAAGLTAPAMACHAQIVDQNGWICLSFKSMVDLVNAIQYGSAYGDVAAEAPDSKIVPVFNQATGTTTFDFVFDSPVNGSNFMIAFLAQKGITSQVCSN